MKDIFEYIGPLWPVLGYSWIAVLCAILAATGPTLWKLIVQLWTLRKQRILKRDLFPFYTQLEAQQATRYYVDTKCQNVAPSKDEEPRLDDDKAVKQSGLFFFLRKAFNPKKEDCQFYIILADSGMGKTTFLLNLYLRYINQFAPPQYDIKIFPLAFPDADKKIAAIEKKRETILLLDAFDEDMQAVHDYKARLDRLIALTRDFREVVITCRTQFFPSEYEEPRETGVMRYGGAGGEQEFYKFYLSPFDDADIRAYLQKRFPWWLRDKRQKAQKIVEHSPNLMVRPMLLQHIEDLLQHNKTYTSSHAVYAELIKRWIEREAEKVGPQRRKRYIEELYQFTREIALDLYGRRRERQGGLLISGAEIQPFADRHNIKLSKVEMKSKSLLNRNARGYYKFSHKSILEYFLAEEAFFNAEFRAELHFEGMDQARAVFDEMVFEKLTLPFFSRGDVSGEYRLKGGSAGILTKLPRERVAAIAELKLFEWNDSDDVLLLAGLKGLQRLYVPQLQIPAGLCKALPECSIGIVLRSSPQTVSESEFTALFELDENQRPLHYIQNDYEDRRDVIVDRITGLMWQKAGTSSRVTLPDARKYVKSLNRKRFAGFSDWRLPTIPELMSLLEPKQTSGDLYIDPIFDATQRWCWSGDLRQIKGESSSESAWFVNFGNGNVRWLNFEGIFYVRAVRSWQ